MNENVNYVSSPELLSDNDDDSGDAYDLPPFLRERNY